MKTKRRRELTIDLDRLLERGPKMLPGVMELAQANGVNLPGWTGLALGLAQMAAPFLSMGGSDGGPDADGKLAEYWRRRESFTDADVAWAWGELCRAAEAGHLSRDVLSGVSAALRIMGATDEASTRACLDRLVSDVGASDDVRRVGDLLGWTLTLMQRPAQQGE